MDKTEQQQKSFLTAFAQFLALLQKFYFWKNTSAYLDPILTFF